MDPMALFSSAMISYHKSLLRSPSLYKLLVDVSGTLTFHLKKAKDCRACWLQGRSDLSQCLQARGRHVPAQISEAWGTNLHDM
jgi:hypothetical protein